MLEPTKLGRFGECSLMLMTEDPSGAFERILEGLDQQSDLTDLGADAGMMFGSAQVGLVASTSSPPVDKEEHEDGHRLLFIALFLSDQDEDEDVSAYPDHGPWGGEIQAVDFIKLMSAVGGALPRRHEFLHQCHLSASVDQAQLEFPLPIRLWQSKRPFGSLIGARFALEERGARDGWITLEINEDEINASLHFMRSMRLDIDMVEKAWTFVRRIYDNVVVLDDGAGDASR